MDWRLWMFAFLLGLTWLVVTPVCVWVLFSRGRPVAIRAMAAVALTALQAGTLAVGFTRQTSAPHSSEPPLAERPAVTPGGSATDHTRPTTRPTLAARPGGPDAAPAASADPEPDCTDRIPVPESVRLSFRGRALHGVTLYWPAAMARCDIAAVALRPVGRRLRIWVGEQQAGSQDSAQRVPVRIVDGMATLNLRLNQPVRQGKRYVAVDGHTGHRIPLRHRP